MANIFSCISYLRQLHLTILAYNKEQHLKNKKMSTVCVPISFHLSTKVNAKLVHAHLFTAFNLAIIRKACLICIVLKIFLQ